MYTWLPLYQSPDAMSILILALRLPKISETMESVPRTIAYLTCTITVICLTPSVGVLSLTDYV